MLMAFEDVPMTMSGSSRTGSFELPAAPAAAQQARNESAAAALRIPCFINDSLIFLVD
jgi:hypothetical protein